MYKNKDFIFYNIGGVNIFYFCMSKNVHVKDPTLKSTTWESCDIYTQQSAYIIMSDHNNRYRFWHVPAMKNVRWNVAGIHRQPTTDRFSNSSLWTSTNPSRTSGPKDLNMPGNRKLANAQPPTTYQAQLSSNVRCWCSYSGCWWYWPRMVDDGDDPAARRET